MESGTKKQRQSVHVADTKKAAATISESGQKIAESVKDAAQVISEQVGARGAEFLDQAKQKAGVVYEQANKRMNEQYEKAVDYGRENPGTTALIAFGVGVGFGMVLLGSFSSTRHPRNRMVEPVLEAVSNLARAYFR